MGIKRRTFLTGAGAAAATAVAAVMCRDGERPANPEEQNQEQGQPTATPTLPKQKNNILLLCLDDMRDWVGYKNTHPGVYTPNIDKLRAQSYSYNRAYCSVPVCIASRGSMLWGLSPETAKLDGLNDDAPYSALTTSESLHPLPHWFSEAGFETISTGKVFHYQMGTPRFWDVFQPYKNASAGWGDHGTLFDYGVLPEDEMHTDQLSANFAIEQLQTQRDKPFFMSIGLYQPHVPWRLPQWAFDLHPLQDVALPEVRLADLDDIPPGGVEIAKFPGAEINGTYVSQHDMVINAGLWREHVQAYLAACSHTDAMVGQIIDALDKSEYADNTTVVLWSDHGYHLGENLHWRKMALWEQATRVPLLIRTPGRENAGGSFDEPVSLLDLAPTLTDLAGIKQPNQFEGSSLIGITAADAAARPPHMRWGTAVSTRKGKWRWTRYENGGQELYNLDNDPQEYVNLLGTSGKLKGGLDSLS